MKNIFNKAKGVFVYPFLFLLTLVSCTKEAELGLEVLPENNQVGAFETDTFSITARTIPADSIRTDERVLLLTGMYQDELFGDVYSTFYTQLRPEQENLDFDGKEVLFDSAFLTLKYYENNPFYTKKDYLTNGIDKLHLYVHEITEDLNLDSNYINTSSVQYDPNPIGSFIGVNPTQANDSIFGLNTLTIPINSTWAEQLLLSDEIQNTEAFVELMKGITVITDPLSVPSNGGVIYLFDPLNALTRLHLHYRTRDLGDTGSYVNEEFDLIIDQRTPRFNNHTINRTNTIVEEAISNPTANQEQHYLQGIGGTYVELDCSSFLEFFKENPAVLNLVELIVPIDQPSFEDYAAPSSLYFKYYNENGTSSFTVDQFEASGTHIDGRLDTEKMQYRFVLTRHFQQLVLDYRNGINTNFGFLLTPTNEPVQPQRIVINGSSPDNDEKIKFRFVYTPI